MKRFHFLFISVLIVFCSCNSITSGHYVLTDENADYLEPKYEYWFSEELADDGDQLIRLRGFDKAKKRKIWIFESFPKTENETPGYLRTTSLSNGLQLFQLTTWDSRKEIILFYGKRSNDSTFIFYSLNDEAIKTARKDKLLYPIRNQIHLRRNEIYFDSIAVANNSERILEFLKSGFDLKSDFEKDSLILRGSNDPLQFKKTEN